jgi:hypothetical protein
MQAVVAVQREQQDQRRQGIWDAQGIKEAYIQVSSQRMREAIQNAYIDNMAIKVYLADAMLELEAEYKAQREKEAKKSSGGTVFSFLQRSFASLSSKKRLGPLKVPAQPA